METAIIVVAIVFMAYRMGVIKLAQSSSDRIISQADNALELWELDGAVKRTKKYGKLQSQLADTSVRRSSADEIRKMLKELEATK